MNIHLSHTNRFLYQILNTEPVRLHFCSHAFNRRFKHSLLSRDVSFYVSQQDNDLIKLQKRLLNATWFNASFAQRLEAMTLELQRRSYHLFHDHDFDGKALGGTIASSKEAVHRNCLGKYNTMCLPRRWLARPWTDDRIALFHRLWSWHLYPKHSPVHLGNDDRMLLREAIGRASSEGREEVAKILQSDAAFCELSLSVDEAISSTWLSESSARAAVSLPEN